MRAPPLLLAAMLAVAGSGTARAQPANDPVLTRMSVDQTSIFLQDNNYPAEVSTNRDGTRSLKTKVAGLVTFVNFYSCDGGEQCRSIQLRAFFDNPRKRGLEFANQWNRSKRFVKLYIDTDRSILAEMDVVVEGGITRPNLLAALDLYGALLKQFREDYSK